MDYTLIMTTSSEIKLYFNIYKKYMFKNLLHVLFVFGLFCFVLLKKSSKMFTLPYDCLSETDCGICVACLAQEVEDRAAGC